MVSAALQSLSHRSWNKLSDAPVSCSTSESSMTPFCLKLCLRGSCLFERLILSSARLAVPMEFSYEIINARAHDVHLLPAIELAAAQLLLGQMPDSALNVTTSVQEFQEAQAEARLWVVLARDTPVGFAQVELLGTHAAHLKEIDVHPDHGRRGLGARLVNTVCEWASARGYPAITLTTFRDVPWNMPFYAHHGFEIIPTDDLNAALASILQAEARHGLDIARRVAMKRRLSSPAEISR